MYQVKARIVLRSGGARERQFDMFRDAMIWVESVVEEMADAALIQTVTFDCIAPDWKAS